MPKPGPRTTYKYSDEFKATAVRLSELAGVEVQDVAASLYIHSFMLSRWRKQAREGQIVTKGVAVDKQAIEFTSAQKARSSPSSTGTKKPAVTRVVPLDGAVMATGARFVVYQPRLRPATWKVTGLEAPRRFVWEARSPGLHMLAEHAVTPQPPASSAVLLRYSFGGLFGGLLGKLFRSTVEHHLAQEAAALKTKVEGLR